MADISLTTSYVVGAPRAKVYAAWLDPAGLASILTVDPDEPVHGVTIDDQVDGIFAFQLDAEDDSRMECRYTALEPGALIAFLWDVAGDRPGSTVTVHFRPVAEGTEVVLVHDRLPNRIVRDVLLGRWDKSLQNLAGLFARG